MDPQQWLGQRDSENLIYGHEDFLSELNQKVTTGWINRGLPTEVPNRQFNENGFINIEGEIINHIRMLENKSD